ncbi:hypothetical protein E1176_09355 [Fulvivirga sp. RKSG066]|uniref:ATP-grasp domain-containing protein n=1 Tax=Fulvivirga aurantia TaxID=2529383 RepID=UPI0012BD11CC|nr:hypothetical protein [Fulvivirga aurantia]MTI21225.1 hypothetical protein [Fulvivirga aurantia]
MTKYDVTILTTQAYINPPEVDDYINNVLTEDRLVKEALEAKGLRVTRVSWDDPDFDWSGTRSVLFRTIWDYFERYNEFEPWLKRISTLTKTINPIELIWWNIDKHYLLDLEQWGVNIVPTLYITKGSKEPLAELISKSGWQNVILKPAISGTARHTYRINASKVSAYTELYGQLIANESMMLQPFIKNILSEGEVSHMVFNGKYSHSVLKRAAEGDFRVQDDFGGSVFEYEASQEEIDFAEGVIDKCKLKPVYARVDVVRDNNNQLAVAELEAIEPELWFRMCPTAAQSLATGVCDFLD